jgi:two-component system, cell cycle response regulator
VPRATRVVPATPYRSRTKQEEPSSALALQIVQAACRKDASVEELAELARVDAAFALRLLALVNSAASGMANQVGDVTRASAMLGLGGMRNVGLSLAVDDLLPSGELGDELLAGTLRRAVAAREIGKCLALDSSECFTTGLLIDVGLMSIARSDPARAQRFVSALPAARTLFEREESGLPHHAVGSAMAMEWGLPEAIVEAIRMHHEKKTPEGELARVAWAAERVASLYEDVDVTGARGRAEAALLAVGVAKRDLATVIEGIPVAVDEAASQFSRGIDSQLSVDELMRDANARLVELNGQFMATLKRLEQLLAEKEFLAASLHEANERLTEQASTDPLTGLANKRHFDQGLDASIEKARLLHRPLSVVMVDVDHFKKFNDTWGHQAGDEVLKQVAVVLRDGCRGSDIAARYGGEEFVLILPNANPKNACLVAERIRSKLEKTVVEFEGNSLSVTASFGIASLSTKDGEDAAESLLRRSDGALYRAKERGRNCVSSAV